MSANRDFRTHRIVDEFLAETSLPVSGEHACNYRPGQMACNEFFAASELPPAMYEAFIDRGFRRSGTCIYRPVCSDCNACRSLRVNVTEFQPSKSMRRINRRNDDVTMTHGPPTPTDQKYDLFRKYLDTQHDGTMSDSWETYEDFLYTSCVPTVEFEYRIGRRLIGVSIADKCTGGISSVYMFFDPAERRRGLGTFSILREIEFCRQRDLPWYYLGYHVADCGKMAYKARFKPHDLLDDGHRWVRCQTAK
jgi:arginine-tRNA-protein transferase